MSVGHSRLTRIPGGSTTAAAGSPRTVRATAAVTPLPSFVVVVCRISVIGGAALLGLAAGFNPALAAAAVLGLAYIGLVVTNLTAALALFTVLAFVESLGGGEGGTSYLKLAGVLLVGVWLVSIFRRGSGETSFPSVHPWAAYALVTLVAWTGLTAVWADYPSVSVSTTIRLVQQVVLFFIVFTAASTGRHSILALVAAYLVGSSVSSALALTDPTATMVDGDGLERASGGAGDPNALAALLVPALSLSAALLVSRSMPAWGRLLVLVSLALCLAVFLLTLSRGGMIGLGVALLGALVFGGRWRRHVLVLSAVVAAAVVCFYAFFADPAAIQRAVTPSAEGGSGRSDIWRMGARMVRDNPIGGVGVGNYSLVSNQYLVRAGLVERDDYILDDPKQAHNMYLDMAAETGLVGLSLFVGLLAFSLWTALKAARRFERAGDHDMELLARATFVGVLGLLAADFFLSEQFSKQLWILLALGPALLNVAARQALNK